MKRYRGPALPGPCVHASSCVRGPVGRDPGRPPWLLASLTTSVRPSSNEPCRAAMAAWAAGALAMVTKATANYRRRSWWTCSETGFQKRDETRRAAVRYRGDRSPDGVMQPQPPRRNRGRSGGPPCEGSTRNEREQPSVLTNGRAPAPEQGSNPWKREPFHCLAAPVERDCPPGGVRQQCKRLRNPDTGACGPAAGKRPGKQRNGGNALRRPFKQAVPSRRNAARI